MTKASYEKEMREFENKWKKDVAQLAINQLKADQKTGDELADTLFESFYEEGITPQDAINEEIDAMRGEI